MRLSVENVLEKQGFQPLCVKPQFSKIPEDVNKTADLTDPTNALIFNKCYVAASP